jgi:hypothetical protein
MNLNNRNHVNIIGMVLAFFAPLFKEKVKITILPFFVITFGTEYESLNHHLVARVGVSYISP